MSWLLLRLAKCFVDHHAVALHHIARNVDIPFIRCVGNDVPALFPGIAGSLPDSVVIVPRYAPDLGSVSCNRAATRLTDTCVNVNDTATAEFLGSPGDRSAVVSICRTCHRDLGRGLRKQFR